jgi:hypothetical protein
MLADVAQEIDVAQRSSHSALFTSGESVGPSP